MNCAAVDPAQPVFPIGIVAQMLGVTQATLRIWEKKGLVKPERLGKNRYYSQADVDRLREIKYLLQERRMNIAGARDRLFESRCWEVKNCGQKKFRCPVYAAREKNQRWSSMSSRKSSS